ncbi:MAG: molybdenum cofactor guanylyltransferase [bacterium]
MTDNITGIILAGGKSRRMGTDKSFVLWNGKPAIEILIDKMASLFSELIIVTNRPHLYKKYEIKTVKDVLPDRGPLGGIYSGLLLSKRMYGFVVACDMPFLNLDSVRYIAGKREGYDAVVAEFNGRFEPLCAVYSKNCIKSIENRFSANNLRVVDFLRDIKLRIIEEKEFREVDSGRACFVNINTPEEYSKYKDNSIY